MPLGTAMTSTDPAWDSSVPESTTLRAFDRDAHHRVGTAGSGDSNGLTATTTKVHGTNPTALSQLFLGRAYKD